jgi:hypothetical protein
VGFIDDNPLRRGMTIHGVRVLGGLSEVERLVDRHRVSAIVVSTSKITAARSDRLMEISRTHGVAIYWIRIALVPFERADLPPAVGVSVASPPQSDSSCADEAKPRRGAAALGTLARHERS